MGKNPKLGQLYHQTELNRMCSELTAKTLRWTRTMSFKRNFEMLLSCDCYCKITAEFPPVPCLLAQQTLMLLNLAIVFMLFHRWLQTLRRKRPVPKVLMSGTSPWEGHVWWPLLSLPLFIMSVPPRDKLYFLCQLLSATEMSLSAERPALRCPRSCFWDGALVTQGTRGGSGGWHQCLAVPLL